MSMNPENLHFRVFNEQTGSIAYYNGLFMPSSLESGKHIHIEFMSSLTDKYGEAIYDGDIVTVTDNDFSYKAIVVVDFKNGTLLTPVEGVSLRTVTSQYFDAQKRQLEVVAHVGPKEE